MSHRELKFLFKHSTVYGLGSIAGQAVGFFLLPIYTRYLTPTDYGVAAIIEITLGLLSILVVSGLADSITRFYYDFQGEKEKQVTISTLYWIIFLFAMVAFPLLYIFAPSLSNLLFNADAYVKHIRIGGAALFLGLSVDVGLLYYRIKSQSMLFVVISLITLLLLVSFNITFIVFMRTGLIGIFYSMFLSRVVLIFLVVVPILWRVGIRFSSALAKNMILFSFPLVFSNLFRQLVSESDKYFINYFFSPFETGIYAIASKIGTSVHLLITSPFLQSFGPKRFDIMHQHNAKETYASIFNYYLLILGTAGLLLSIFSSEIIYLMTTERFFSAARYIPLIVLCWIIFGMRYHFETGILIHKKTKYFAYINACSMTINLFLNYLLISRYKIWGALISLTMTQIVTTGLFYFFGQRLYRISFDLFFAGKLIVALAVLYVASLATSGQSLYISIPLKLGIVAFYAGLIIVLRLVPIQELRYFKGFVAKFFGIASVESVKR
jgi:O-antigen/teichoic acid export membrane protein